MAKKKGIRQSRQDYIKRDIRELKKLGFEEIDVLNGRSIETLAYTQKSYDNYRKHIRFLKKKARTNEHGITFTKKEIAEIKKLENDLYNKKQSEFEKLKKTIGRTITPVEEYYLKGGTVKSSTGNVLNNSYNFGKENIFQKINDKKKLKSIIKQIEDEIENFSYDDVIVSENEFERKILNEFNFELSDEQIKILKDLFSNFNEIEKKAVITNFQRVSQMIYEEDKFLANDRFYDKFQDVFSKAGRSVYTKY